MERSQRSDRMRFAVESHAPLLRPIGQPRNHIVLRRIYLSRYTPSFPHSSLVYASIGRGGQGLSLPEWTPCLLLKHTSTAFAARRYLFFAAASRKRPASLAPNYPSQRSRSSVNPLCLCQVIAANSPLCQASGCGYTQSPPSCIGLRLTEYPRPCSDL